MLDTEVYSNTGGQSSKATPRGAVARFAMAGRPSAKKDLALMAMAYGNVYVAQVALGADDGQVLKAFTEAAAWDGPSMIIGYGPCIAHGFDLARSLDHQKTAVKSGYWPLFRFKPADGAVTAALMLDSKAPSVPLEQFTSTEDRYTMLAKSNPEAAKRLAIEAQHDVEDRWKRYTQMAEMAKATVTHTDAEPA